MNCESGIRNHFFQVLTGIGFVFVLAVFWNAGVDRQWHSFIPHPLIETVYADDDEDEEEDEDDEDDEDDNEDERKEKKKTTETRYVTRYEVREVPKTVVVIPEEYRKDTDGDKLVDALDPDPDTPQREYFTDDDGDAVPNVFDRHPQEDDFTYFESFYDTNGDGIIDSFEELVRQ